MYNFAEIFLKSLFIMRQFTILHLNFVCSHCNLKLYLVKTWDFSMMGQLIKQKRRSMYQISFYLGWDAVLCEKYLLVSLSVSSDWTIDFSSPNKRQKKWKNEKKIYWKWPYVWICSILSTYISNSSQGPIDHQTSSINWESPWAKNPYVRCFAIFEAVEQVKHKIQGGSIFV